MSLIYSDINLEYGASTVWKVTEDLSFFKEKLNCEVPQEHAQSKKRSIEWLSSRYLMSQTEGIEPHQIIKDEFGKPHIKKGQKELSISHSNGFVAVAFHNEPIGIDIQTYVSKITRIASKYTDDSEMQKYEKAFDEIKTLHIIWTLKEAVFKLYGRKELAFKEGIRIENVTIDNGIIQSEGVITKLNESYLFKAQNRVMKDYCFARAVYRN